jgi:hypothetical protein
MPLAPITGEKDDEYANIKPFASCTVELDDNDDVKEAYNMAGEAVFEQIKEFREEFIALYKPTKGKSRG